jgi:hypothetical protein
MAAKKSTKKEEVKKMNQNEALSMIAHLMEKKQKCDKIWRWVMGVLVFLIVVFFYFGNIITYYLNNWIYQLINK